MPPSLGAGDFLAVDLLNTLDYGELIKESRATHLLHLAWYAEYEKFWLSPLNLRWVDATVRLTEAFCLADGKRVVMAGTCAEYDWSYGYFHEDTTPLNPATLYGSAKDATRRLVTAVCERHQVSCSWGRIFMPYGPGEDGRRLIPSLIDVFEDRRAPFGVNAMAFRDFLHVEDVAEGFLTLLKDDAEGTFNISSAQPTQIAEVVTRLALARNANPQRVLALHSQRPSDPTLIVGNNKKLLALGWRPKHQLGEFSGNKALE
jgi:nucleoside-diphosphate-sugar epimerase